MKRPPWFEIAATAAAALLTGFLIWAVLIRPGQMKEQAAEATATAAQAGAQVKAAGDAAVITHRYVEKTREIERIRDEGNAAIAAAEGADQMVPPDVYWAFAGAVCLRRQGAGDPACDRLFPDGRPPAADTEPEGAASGSR